MRGGFQQLHLGQIYALSPADVDAPPEFVLANCADCHEDIDYLICVQWADFQGRPFDPRSRKELRFLAITVAKP
jgi:hypothetical protein